jgi:hypothetical protein
MLRSVGSIRVICGIRVKAVVVLVSVVLAFGGSGSPECPTRVEPTKSVCVLLLPTNPPTSSREMT